MPRFRWPLARRVRVNDPVGLYSAFGGMTGAYVSADAARAPDGRDWRMCDRDDQHPPHGWLHGLWAVTCPGRWQGEHRCADRR